MSNRVEEDPETTIGRRLMIMTFRPGGQHRGLGRVNVGPLLMAVATVIPVEPVVDTVRGLGTVGGCQ